MFLKRIAIVIILALCGACAPIQLKEELKPSTVDEAGYLIGTIGHKRWGPFGSHSFIFQGIVFSPKDSQDSAAGTIGFLNGGFGDNPIDYKDSNHLGAAFSIPLKPGDYEIRGVRFTSDDGGTIQRAPDCFMAIPFTITKGKRTYIGDFLASTLSENRKVYKNYFPPGFFWFSDKFEVDMPLLNKKYPDQVNLETINSVPTKDYPPCIINTKTVIE
jgi:hypothetical protein